MNAAMQKMDETVSSQVTSVAYLTKHTPKNRGGGDRTNSGGGSGRNGRVDGQPKLEREKHKCQKCKMMVWQKESNCPDYERNKSKRWNCWECVLE